MGILGYINKKREEFAEKKLVAREKQAIGLERENKVLEVEHANLRQKAKSEMEKTKIAKEKMKRPSRFSQLTSGLKSGSAKETFTGTAPNTFSIGNKERKKKSIFEM